jgi:hypothetical protein
VDDEEGCPECLDEDDEREDIIRCGCGAALTAEEEPEGICAACAEEG